MKYRAFVLLLATIFGPAGAQETVVPHVVLRGNPRVVLGQDLVVDSIGSTMLPSGLIRWQIVEPSKIPAGAHILQLDSGGRSNAALVWRVPPQGTYLIAATVYGSPDGTGYPVPDTGVYRVIVAPAPKPSPEPGPIPGPEPTPNPKPTPPPNPVPTPTPQVIPKPIVVPESTRIYAIYCYKLPDPAKTTAQDLAIADLVASPTIRTRLAALNVEWHAWDSDRPELKAGTSFNALIDRGLLPLMVVYDLSAPRGRFFDPAGIPDNPAANTAWKPPATEAEIVQYFARLRGK